MKDRDVAISKPHIFKASLRGWWCCLHGYVVGFGRTPEEAYTEWQRVNA